MKPLFSAQQEPNYQSDQWLAFRKAIYYYNFLFFSIITPTITVNVSKINWVLKMVKHF
ncbi:hypothetical protein B4135_0228 [Caldibacillus debilis]|uniref:Uncharacterized protein n=1 Tax=Caldibacillus debilis TaxID=301148 RepID=A0A150M9B1_9BACI|nr:hypothetical protein B4135_0228 [Caldibacillus debilis]